MSNRITEIETYNLIPSWEGNGNHHCEKFPQENYSGEDTLHSNSRRSESSMALGGKKNSF